MNAERGWTPCKHYQNCIGWCPKCLNDPRQAGSPAWQDFHFTTNDPEFVALLRACTETGELLKKTFQKVLIR